MDMTDSGFLAAAGGRIEYARWGTAEPGAPVLVLLHEGLGCVGTWRDWPGVLAGETGCEVFAYSRFGYGASSPATLPRPLDFMAREGEVILPAVLEAAGIPEPILIGHSDGGTIALLCAAAGGVSLRGVVALAAHAFNEPRCIEGIRAAREAFRSGSLRGRLARHHGERTDDAFCGWCDLWLSTEFEHWSIEEALAGIGTPLLVVQGRDDPYGTLRQVEAIAGGVGGPRETLVLDGCGHSPHRDRTRATTRAIARFVAGLG